MSQVDSSSRIHPFGIGLHVEQYIISDVNGINDSPLNKIILCVSPNNKYRFEPEFGLSFSENKTNKTSTNSVHFGLRAFRMIQRNKLNLYGGLRLGYQNVKKTREAPNSEKYSLRTNILMIGLAIGSEYYIGTNFSIGGEIGLKGMALKTMADSDVADYEAEKIHRLLTDVGLFVRFYF